MATRQRTPEQAERKRQSIRAWKARQQLLAAEANVRGVHFSESVAVGVSGYHCGCRCDGCKAAMSEYARHSPCYAKHRKIAVERERTDPVLGERRRVARRELAREAMKDPVRRKKAYAYTSNRKRRMMDELDALKVARGCADCGWNGSAVGLDFDHIKPGKQRTMAQAVGSASKSRIAAELARCETVCVNCHRLRTVARRGPTDTTDWRQRWLTKRREMLAAIKVKAGCADCGYNAHAEALDFDHVRGRKLFSITKGAYRPLPILMAEVAKCQTICARCHRVRTWQTKVSGHRVEAA